MLRGLIFFAGGILPLSEVRAAFNYTPMEEVPGFGTTNDFPTLVENIYQFGIWTIGIAALFMVTIGGFTYMTSAGNTSKAGTGKKIVTDALIGVVLALTAYLLFSVINPNLVNINLNVVPTDVNGVGNGTVAECTPACQNGQVCRGGSCVDPSPVGTDTQSAAQALLANGNVTWDNNPDCAGVTPRSNIDQAASGECSSACSTGCNCSACVTLSATLLNNLNTLCNNYNPCEIVSLAGGQHSTNSRHYQGRAADIQPGNRSQWSSAVSQLNGMGCNAFCDTNGSHVPCSTATHIHVSC